MTEETLERTDSQSQERHVDELTGVDDYWLTITDAARVTRRQEVTIRRWIKNGSLPVRSQAVGLNQRSRQVRASDLKKLTPIIDNSAVISRSEGRLNLTSIPVEQAAIKEGQQLIVEQMGDLRDQLSSQKQAYTQALEEQATYHQQMLSALQELLSRQMIEQHQQQEMQAQQIEKRLSSQAKQQEEQLQHLERLQQTMIEQHSQYNALLQQIKEEQHDFASKQQVQGNRLNTLQERLSEQQVQQEQQRELLAQTHNDLMQKMIQQEEAQFKKLLHVTESIAHCYRQNEHTLQEVASFSTKQQEALQQYQTQSETLLAQFQQRTEHIIQRFYRQSIINGDIQMQKFEALAQKMAEQEAQLASQQIGQEHIYELLDMQQRQLDDFSGIIKRLGAQKNSQ